MENCSSSEWQDFNIEQPTYSLEKTNQLGGFYVNGKPLPREIRLRVLQFAQMGVRPCEISRQLRITHGCISKLLSKFHETGSIDPGNKNVGRPKVITPDIETKIDQYRNEQPGIFSWELKDRLIKEQVCTPDNAPSLSSISRLIKSKIVSEANRKKIKNMELKMNMGDEEIQEVPSEASTPSKCCSYCCSSSSSISSSSSQCDSSQNSPSSSTRSEQATQHMPFSIETILSSDINLESQHCTLSTATVGTFNVQAASAETFDPVTPFEEHYAALNRSGQQKRHRTKFTSRQLEELAIEFQLNPYPDIWKRQELALKLDVEESRIQVWFSNKRAKGKKRSNSISLPSLSESDDKHKEPQNNHDMCTCRPYSAPVIMCLPYTVGPSRFFFPPGYKK